jgi:hypothetical protein
MFTLYFCDMNEPHYEFQETDDIYVYHFLSLGKKNIPKQVIFYPTEDLENTYVLAFGDLLPNNAINCYSDSNNGDLRFVMTTVFKIAVQFLAKKPEARLLFWGSDQRRNSLYSYIITKNLDTLELSYDIYGIKANEEYELFLPHSEYSSFINKKK